MPLRWFLSLSFLLLGVCSTPALQVAASGNSASAPIASSASAPSASSKPDAGSTPSTQSSSTNPENSAQPADKKDAPEKQQDTPRPGGRVVRSIVGFEHAGASSAPSTQHFFFDLFGSQPLSIQRTTPPVVDPTDLGPRFGGWFDLRVSSTPQQINTSVAQFAASFAQQVGQLKVNEVAQSFEFLGGVSYRIWEWHHLFAGPQKGTVEKLGVHLILGGGVATPLAPKDSVQIFQVPQNQADFFSTYPQATGKQFVAFSLPDRNRFFREAFGGLRLMTSTWCPKKTDTSNCGEDGNTKTFSGNYVLLPPAMLDITYGFNEAITGGVIHGGVMRLEGFAPLPLWDKLHSSVYLFATGLFKFSRPQISVPFILDEAPQGTSATSAQTVVITTPQADRDYYRVGVGIDLVNLIAKWNLTGKNTPAPPKEVAAQQ